MDEDNNYSTQDVMCHELQKFYGSYAVILSKKLGAEMTKFCFQINLV